MTKKKVGIYWRLCWGFIIPAFLITIFIYFLMKLKPLTYGIYDLEYPLRLRGNNKLPNHLIFYLFFSVFGWSIVGIVVIQAIIWITYYLWLHRAYPTKQVWAESRFYVTDINKKEVLFGKKS